jgi:hypothetical protein
MTNTIDNQPEQHEPEYVAVPPSPLAYSAPPTPPSHSRGKLIALIVVAAVLLVATAIGIAVAVTGQKGVVVGKEPSSSDFSTAATDNAPAPDPTTETPEPDPTTDPAEAVRQWITDNDMVTLMRNVASDLGSIQTDATNVDIEQMHADCASLQSDVATIDDVLPAPDTVLNREARLMDTYLRRSAVQCQHISLDNVAAIRASTRNVNLARPHIEAATARLNELS